MTLPKPLSSRERSELLMQHLDAVANDPDYWSPFAKPFNEPIVEETPEPTARKRRNRRLLNTTSATASDRTTRPRWKRSRPGPRVRNVVSIPSPSPSSTTTPMPTTWRRNW